KIADFAGQVKTEMGKASWPTREELVTSITVVITATILLAIFIGVCDMVLSRVIKILIGGTVLGDIS
ncbi:MAG: preprotein translocase subunit SecE, partial [Candidatus Omnitrophica bacterium]|nr:preprotein translocase subunit SecE [Candidatus Omnitrophota bacterium]